MKAGCVGEFSIRRAGSFVEDLLHASGRVGIQHEDLAEVGAGSFQQVQAVALWLGKGVFVTEDDLVGIVVELAESDESAAFLDLAGTLDPEALRVGEDAGVLLRDKDGLLAPCL